MHRRLILKAIGSRRGQAVLELERPARLTQRDLDEALAAAAQRLGAKITYQPSAPKADGLAKPPAESDS